MILVFQFFRLSQKVRFFISPVSYCFDVSRKPRHGKMHEVRYRKICLFNSVEDCFLYNCGYSSSFPLSRSVMLHFPTRFHQNQKRMLSFEDHFSFPPQTAPTTFKHLKSESSHHRLCTTTKSTFRKSSKRIFDISSFSNFSWTLETEVFEKTMNYRFAWFYCVAFFNNGAKSMILVKHDFTETVFWFCRERKDDFSEPWF